MNITHHRRRCRHHPTQTRKVTTIMLWNTNIATRDRDCYCVSRTQMYYSLTYLLTYYLLACLLAYLLTGMFIYSLTYILTCSLANNVLTHYLLTLLTYSHAYLLTYFLACLLFTYLFTYYLLARLLPYLLIYLVADIIWRGTRTQTLFNMGMNVHTMQAKNGHEHNSPPIRIQTPSDTDKEVVNHTVMKH